MRGFWCFLLLFSSHALASTSGWMADVLPSQEPKEVIAAMEWDETTAPIEVISKGTDFESRVEVKFKFKQDDWNLIRDNEHLQPVDPESGEYAIWVPLLGEITPVDILAVSPYGEVEMQKVLVRVPEWKEFRQKGAEAPPKRTYLFSSLGLSQLSFQETGLADFSLFSTTLKFSFSYLLTPPQWEFGANGFVNLLPIQTKGIGSTIRFLGLNLRFGYVFPFVKDPSRLSFLIGAYYSSMLGTDGSFGYKTLLYPQLYPVYRVKTRKGDSYYCYLKYVPLVQGIGLSFSEREVAIGVGYEHPVRGGHPFSVGIDVSDLRFNVTSSRRIVSQSVSISFGYGW